MPDIIHRQVTDPNLDSFLKKFLREIEELTYFPMKSGFSIFDFLTHSVLDEYEKQIRITKDDLEINSMLIQKVSEFNDTAIFDMLNEFVLIKRKDKRIEDYAN